MTSFEKEVKENPYQKEAGKARERKASPEYIERMEFLAKGENVQKDINKWVNSVSKEEMWFSDKKHQKIILHKAIQQGVQIAINIRKGAKE